MSDSSISRRTFVAATAAVGYGLMRPGLRALGATDSVLRGGNVIEPFDYQGVALTPSRWQKQFQSARDFYLNVSDDDILHGYRAAGSRAARRERRWAGGVRLIVIRCLANGCRG